MSKSLAFQIHNNTLSDLALSCFPCLQPLKSVGDFLMTKRAPNLLDVGKIESSHTSLLLASSPTPTEKCLNSQDGNYAKYPLTLKPQSESCSANPVIVISRSRNNFSKIILVRRVCHHRAHNEHFWENTRDIAILIPSLCPTYIIYLIGFDRKIK